MGHETVIHLFKNGAGEIVETTGDVTYNVTQTIVNIDESVPGERLVTFTHFVSPR